MAPNPAPRPQLPPPPTPPLGLLTAVVPDPVVVAPVALEVPELVPLVVPEVVPVAEVPLPVVVAPPGTS